MPAKVGRNDPCPCGSGKKYKRCCLATHADTDLGRLRLRRVEGRLVEAVLRYVLERYGEAVVEAAWTEFWTGDEPPGPPHEHIEFETVFLPWFLFNWLPDLGPDVWPKHRPEKTPSLEYLERHSHQIDELERRFVEEAFASPFSFHEVLRIDAGRSLTLRDLLTGKVRTVAERSGTSSVRAGGVVFARALALDGTAILFGCAPLLIPPDELITLIELREDLGSGGWLTEDGVSDYEFEIRAAYLEIVDRLRNPILPELRNTDGDPLAFTKLHFDLHVTPAEALQKLHALAAGENTSEILADAGRDASGTAESLSFDWTRPGNPVHKGMENTIRGHIRIERGTLVGEVNSNRRAEELRAEIETRLGDGARFRHATIESPAKMLEERAGRRESASDRRVREENDRLMAMPEVQAHLRAMSERHWEAWVDEKIPALGDVTPREAARTPSGRERLEALLRSFEWKTGGDPARESLRPDVAKLRRQLGLE